MQFLKCCKYQNDSSGPTSILTKQSALKKYHLRLPSNTPMWGAGGHQPTL